MKNEKCKKGRPSFLFHSSFFIAAGVVSFLLLTTACTQPPAPSPNYREYAYVTNGKSDSVSVIDLRTFRVAATVPVGRGPTGVAASPTKNEIYVVNTDSDNVSVVDAEQNKVVAAIGVHRAPEFIDVSRDGARAYVANSGSANVSVIDLAQRKVVANIGVGGQPWLARVSPDGKTVAVSNNADGSVSIIDTGKLAVRATVPVCRVPARHRDSSRLQQGLRRLHRLEPGGGRRPAAGEAAGAARRW